MNNTEPARNLSEGYVSPPAARPPQGTHGLLRLVLPGQFCAAFCIAFVAGVTGWYAASHHAAGPNAAALQKRAAALARVFEETAAARRFSRMDKLAHGLKAALNLQISIFNRQGEQLSGSTAEAAALPDGAAAREILQALAGHVSTTIHDGLAGEGRFLIAAAPLHEEGRIIGAIRLAQPMPPARIGWGLLIGGLAAAILMLALAALAAAFLLLRPISGPLKDIREGAQRFAGGDLSARLPVSTTAEFAAAARALNSMAHRLDKSIKTVQEQRRELDMVLGGLDEGVIAVDSDERIISVNHAARRMLGLGPLDMGRRFVQELVRSTKLLHFVGELLAGGEPAELEIGLPPETEKLRIRVYGRRLIDELERSMGALVVLSDITELRRLENMRRDFVANVSHELRTPITSIQGFVETLLGGALDKPADARRFLEIVARQADRLDAIIADLLSLSRLEQDGVTIECGRHALHGVIQSALELSQVRARRKNVRFEVSCPAQLEADLNPALIEQALVNLVDNAVKYSKQGAVVQVAAEENPLETIFAVKDHGCGIEVQHLPRLFERFYRVDKARSRELGGTGLGLALVKHIAQAHGGYASVRSTPGEGSEFRLHLPRRHC